MDRVKINITHTGVVLILCIFSMGSILGQSEEQTCDESCHCMSNLTPAGIMISHVHPKKEWMFSYRYMDMGMKGVLSGTTKMNELAVFNQYLMNSTSMRMDMHMLMGMYGITNRITAMAMFHYNMNSMEMSMLTAHDHDHMGSNGSLENSSNMFMHTSGLGDSKLNLLYGLVKNTQHQLILGTGLNLPTGSITLLGTTDDMLYENKRLPYMMQLGSGTYDILPSITYTHQQKKWAASAQATATIRPFYNRIGYKYGDDFTFNTWFAYNWWNHFSSSIRLEGSVVGQMKGKDPTIYGYNELSANPVNYGGKKITSYIGLSYGFETGFLKNNRLSIEFGLPVYQNLNGIQLQTKQTITASWNYSF